MSKRKWKPAIATVVSCTWDPSARDDGGGAGYSHVMYGFKVKGKRHTGEFSDYGSRDEDYLKPKQTFEVRYNPADPDESYYPGVRQEPGFRLVALGLGAGAALLAVVVWFLVVRGNR